MNGTFVAAGGCSSCPYRGTCHEARQRIQDQAISVGRHYECEFYRSIDRAHAELMLSPYARWRRGIRGVFGR